MWCNKYRHSKKYLLHCSLLWLDSMILKVFSNVNDSMTLFFLSQKQTNKKSKTHPKTNVWVPRQMGWRDVSGISFLPGLQGGQQQLSLQRLNPAGIRDGRKGLLRACSAVGHSYCPCLIGRLGFFTFFSSFCQWKVA